MDLILGNQLATLGHFCKKQLTVRQDETFRFIRLPLLDYKAPMVGAGALLETYECAAGYINHFQNPGRIKHWLYI